MAIVQDIYNEAPVKGFAGQVQNGETSNRVSRTVEDVAGIAFGEFAFEGTGDHGCTGVPAANKTLGFVIANHGITQVPGGTVGPDTHARYATAGICTMGRGFVNASVAVAKGDDVYVTPARAITNVAAGNVKATKPSGQSWKFDETITAAGLVAVALR